MSGRVWKSSFPLNRGGIVVGYCSKYTVGHGARARRSSWISSLVLRRSRRSSCQPLLAAWSSLMYGLLYTAWWRSVGPAD